MDSTSRTDHLVVKSIRKIAVIGNACSGKTTLTRILSEQLVLPAYHIDSIQYNQQLRIRPHRETIGEITRIQESEVWVLDGYGPLDILQDRLNMADRIVMLDLPVLWNYIFASKRLLSLLLKKKRAELPEGSSERSLSHIYMLFKNIRQIHTKMRPEMFRILQRADLAEKTVIIRDRQKLNAGSGIFSAQRPVDRSEP